MCSYSIKFSNQDISKLQNKYNQKSESDVELIQRKEYNLSKNNNTVNWTVYP